MTTETKIVMINSLAELVEHLTPSWGRCKTMVGEEQCNATSILGVEHCKAHAGTWTPELGIRGWAKDDRVRKGLSIDFDLNMAPVIRHPEIDEGDGKLLEYPFNAEAWSAEIKKRTVYADIDTLALYEFGEECPETVVKWDRTTGNRLPDSTDPEDRLKDFEETCSRRIYKNTGCGAWLAFDRLPPPGPKYSEYWTATFKQDGDRVIITKIETPEGGWWICWQEPNTNGAIAVPLQGQEPEGYVPPELRLPDEDTLMFFGLPTKQQLEEGIPYNQVEVGKNLDEIYRNCVEERHGKLPCTWGPTETLEGKVVQVTCAYEVTKERPWDGEAPNRGVFGVKIGTIVEGSDAEIGPQELRFPFTEWDIDMAVDEIEGEAHYIWMESHACDDCWKDRKEGPVTGEYGGDAVDENCKTCKGTGVPR